MATRSTLMLSLPPQPTARNRATAPRARLLRRNMEHLPGMGEEERLIKGRASGLPDLPAGLPEGYGRPAVSRRFRDARPQTARGSRAPEVVEAVHEVLLEQFPREGAPALEEHAADAPGGQFVQQVSQAAPPGARRQGQVLHAGDGLRLAHHGAQGRLAREGFP